MTTTLPHSECAICSTKDHLLRCGACKVINYCGKEHQTSDRPSHKTVCTTIRKTRERMEYEEERLRNHPGDAFTAPNPFESGVGHFWKITETRDYMQARFQLVEALVKVKTYEAVSMALDHLLDMHRLCRGDNLGIRDLTPHCFLRLGRDQECYDFVLWWRTTGQRSNYNWGNMDEPFLDTKNADVLGSVKPFVSKFPDISHIVAVMLLKIRLLLDLKKLQKFVGPRTLRECVGGAHPSFQSPITTTNKTLLESKDLAPHIKLLESQIDELYKIVQKGNKFFWPALLKLGKSLTAAPQMYALGSKEEMQFKLQYSYDAWVETPGALDVIREKQSTTAT